MKFGDVFPWTWNDSTEPVSHQDLDPACGERLGTMSTNATLWKQTPELTASPSRKYDADVSPLPTSPGVEAILEERDLLRAHLWYYNYIPLEMPGKTTASETVLETTGSPSRAPIANMGAHAPYTHGPRSYWPGVCLDAGEENAVVERDQAKTYAMVARLP